MRLKSLAFSLLVLASSCRTAPLEVDYVYVGPRSLASYWVCTPDPQLCDPPSGQKLVVLWQFTQAEWGALVEPKLHLRVRFADRQEKELWWDLTRYKGKVVYSNIGSSECPPPAINTYRAEVITEGKVAYCVEQALWTEWIALQGGESGCAEPVDSVTAFQSSAEFTERGTVGTVGKAGTQCEKDTGEKGGEQEEEEGGQAGYGWDDLEEIMI